MKFKTLTIVFTLLVIGTVVYQAEAGKKKKLLAALLLGAALKGGGAKIIPLPLPLPLPIPVSHLSSKDTSETPNLATLFVYSDQGNQDDSLSRAVPGSL